MAYYQRIRDLREDIDKTQRQVADDMYVHLILIPYQPVENFLDIISSLSVATLDRRQPACGCAP